MLSDEILFGEHLDPAKADWCALMTHINDLSNQLVSEGKTPGSIVVSGKIVKLFQALNPSNELIVGVHKLPVIYSNKPGDLIFVAAERTPDALYDSWQKKRGKKFPRPQKKDEKIDFWNEIFKGA